MEIPNFKQQEDELYSFTLNALKEIGSSSKDCFSYFAFDCNPDYGEILLCLDTEENSLVTAKKRENYITSDRKKISYDSPSYQLEWAIHNIGNDLVGRVLPFGNNTGDFSHQGFTELYFENWENFSLSEECPDEFEESNESYLSCISAILLSNVIDRLISTNAFEPINTNSPFYCGIGFHESGQKVVRIINWEAK